MKQFFLLLILMCLSTNNFAANRCLTFLDQRIADEQLNLSDCELNPSEVRDVLFFVEQHSDIKRLDLSGNTLSKDNLQQLANIKTLTALIYSYHYWTGALPLTDDDAKILATATALTTLNIQNNIISNAGLIALAQNPHIQSLGIASIQDSIESTEGVIALAGNPHLTSLELGGRHIEQRALIALGKSDSLTHLGISFRFGTFEANEEAFIAGIAKNKHIKSLNIYSNTNAPLQTKTIMAISQMPQLETLSLSIDFNPQDLKYIASNRKIKSLFLFDMSLQDKDLVPLAQMSQLNSLKITGEITAKGLAILSQLPSLKSFELIAYAHNIGNEGGIVLGKYPALEELIIDEIKIGYQGIQALAHNVRLKKLYNLGNSLDSESVMALALNPGLVDLAISFPSLAYEEYRTPISDEAFSKLAENKNLKYLFIDGTMPSASVKFLANNKTLETLWFMPDNNVNMSLLAQNTTLKELIIGEHIFDETFLAFADNKTLNSLGIFTFEKISPSAKDLLLANKYIPYIDLNIEFREDNALFAKMRKKSSKQYNLISSRGHEI